MTAVGLLLIGIFLIVININAIRKEKNSFSTILNNSENNMKDYDLEIGKLRKEFAETILELQKEIEELKVKRELNIEDEYIENDDENNKNLYKDEKNIDNILNSKVVEHENIINDINYDVIRNENQIVTDDNEKNDNDDKKDNSGHNNVRVDEISRLLDEGLLVDEIAEKIGMGKGEVLLIKELYIK